MVRKNTVLYALHGVSYPGVSGSPAKSSYQSSENMQRRMRPPHRLHHPSTNAQWSWTTSIWGIILYEIDGWGQPLTERVKTTLRCPLWISMMENRLLKKIYVCSPLPQERATLPTHQPARNHPPTPALTNQTCHCGQIKHAGSTQLPALWRLAHSRNAGRQQPFFFCFFLLAIIRGRLLFITVMTDDYTVVKPSLYDLHKAKNNNETQMVIF